MSDLTTRTYFLVRAAMQEVRYTIQSGLGVVVSAGTMGYLGGYSPANGQVPAWQMSRHMAVKFETREAAMDAYARSYGQPWMFEPILGSATLITVTEIVMELEEPIPPSAGLPATAIHKLPP